MGFQSFAAIGRNAASNMHWQYVYKASTPTPSTAGYFVDLNQTSGTPKYNPFAGSALTLNQLIGAGNLGVYPGTFETGKTKHILRFQMIQLTVANGPPDYVRLCDYLAFYPLIDTDDPGEQTMDNTAVLPRYASGEGVQIVLIIQSPLATTAPMTIVYTNSEGVTGRTVTFNIIPGLAIGICATSSGANGAAGTASAFVPLTGGDKGVRAIESVTMAGSGGGFVCAALVKPICELQLYESNILSEKYFGIFGQNPPEVLEGCCLNFLIHRGATAAGAYRGELLFVNS
jgi:hypothetical protein